MALDIFKPNTSVIFRIVPKVLLLELRGPALCFTFASYLVYFFDNFQSLIPFILFLFP